MQNDKMTKIRSAFFMELPLTAMKIVLFDTNIMTLFVIEKKINTLCCIS
jgi:hypothetical protein